MRRFLTCLASLGVLAAAPVAVQAQVMIPPRGYGPNPYARPTLSPYLNLIRPNVAANYYLGTLAEFDRRAFQAQVYANPPVDLLAPPAAPNQQDFIPVLPQTGHSVGFQYYNPYVTNTGVTRPYFPLNPNTQQGSGRTMTPASRPMMPQLRQRR